MPLGQSGHETYQKIFVHLFSNIVNILQCLKLAQSATNRTQIRTSTVKTVVRYCGTLAHRLTHTLARDAMTPR